MKKLLMFLSLTMAISAFGADTATMNINAVVLAPLNVTHDGDINFGNIIQNTSSQEITKNFTVTGTPGAHFDFTINDQPLGSFANSELVHADGNSKMPFYTTNRTASAGDLNNPQISQDGNFKFTFTGRTQADQSQTPGSYTGSLVARVQYQ
ncbi:DUF4402 domain-containing protein [Cetobacterium sp.]|uniref:DUF4402 domain-containing protein n=1 Tax=Cetobacterium sp. TaxID=2071632 RepID=UPI003EE424DB